MASRARSHELTTPDPLFLYTFHWPAHTGTIRFTGHQAKFGSKLLEVIRTETLPPSAASGNNKRLRMPLQMSDGRSQILKFIRNEFGQPGLACLLIFVA